jgi:hypothetical protein
MLVTRHHLPSDHDYARPVCITLPAAPWEPGEPLQPKPAPPSEDRGPYQWQIAAQVMQDGKPRTVRDLAEESGVREATVRDWLNRARRRGHVVFLGRDGVEAGRYMWLK